MNRAGSDFLSKNRLQHVALEIAGAAEELFFAFCEANSRLPFLLNERNETHEVRDLKEPVSPRPHVLREFPVVAVARRHGFVDEVRYDGLAAIVIHFYLEVRNSMEIRGVEEFGNAHLELGDDLFLGGYEFLVDADASIAEWRLCSESCCWSWLQSESGGMPAAQGEELSPRLGDPSLSAFVACILPNSC